MCVFMCGVHIHVHVEARRQPHMQSLRGHTLCVLTGVSLETGNWPMIGLGWPASSMDPPVSASQNCDHKRVSPQMALYVGAEGGAQVLLLTKQALHQLSHSPMPRRMVFDNKVLREKKSEGTDPSAPEEKRSHENVPVMLKHTCPNRPGAGRLQTEEKWLNSMSFIVRTTEA